MNTYLLIENGAVINAVVWDGDTEKWSPPTGQTAVPLPSASLAGIGWTYDGTTFTAPAQTKPV